MKYTHRVQYYETDRMGITHHSNYIRWMEEARVAYLDSIGLNFSEIEKRGIMSPVVSVKCSYKKTSTFDDDIEIEVRVKEFKGVKLKLGYTMTKDEEVICTASSTHCFINADGGLINLKKDYPDIYDILSNEVSEE